jgi:uncharacterized protein (TIGR02217 family)
MAFHDTQLPDGFQYGSLAGAGFATIVQETSSGHETRIARQAQARHRFRLVKILQSKSEAKALKAFALGRRGSLHSFKIQDIADSPRGRCPCVMSGKRLSSGVLCWMTARFARFTCGSS